MGLSEVFGNCMLEEDLMERIIPSKSKKIMGMRERIFDDGMLEDGLMKREKSTAWNHATMNPRKLIGKIDDKSIEK